MEVLSTAGKVNHARCILLDVPMKSAEWGDDLFAVLFEVYGKAGIVQEAVRVLDRIKDLGVEKSTKNYDALFKITLRRGRYMTSKWYFNQMMAGGIQPTRHTYNLVNWGMFWSLSLRTAARVYEDMEVKGTAPYVVVNGYLRFRRIDDVEALFVEMKGKNTTPNGMTYTTAVKGYISVGRAAEVFELVEEMRPLRIKPDAVACTRLLPGLCDAGDLLVGTSSSLVISQVLGSFGSRSSCSAYGGVLGRLFD